MPIAIQEYAKSLIFQNVYDYKGEGKHLIVYQEIHETLESAQSVRTNISNGDIYLYTMAIEVRRLPNKNE